MHRDPPPASEGPLLPSEAPTGESAGPERRAAERRAQSLRRALDRRVAAVLESVTHGFLALDPEWRVTYANREAARLNGTTVEALLGRNHWEMWPETVGCEVERWYRDVVHERTPAHFVHHYPVADVWHEIHAYPADDGGIAVLYRDITTERHAEADRRRLAATLAERERELAAVLDNATDVVTRFDRGLRFTYANPAIEGATGLAPHALVGRAPAELPMPPAFAAAWEEALARVFAQGCGEQLGFEYPTPHGPRHFESRLIPERGPDGGVEHVLALTRDVTERVRSEVALAAALDAAQSARADAEAANASKSAFLATMSHELRTPLNAIRGYADLLALGVYGPVTDAQRAALGRIGQSERHLLGLITEILDYARLESGRTRYHLADVAVNEVLVEARSLVEPQLRGKGIDFGYEPGGHEPLAARADAGKLRQIVLNLLSNALKFTPAGGRVALRSRAEPGLAVVEVSDSGPGIPTEQLERVFQPFVQLNRTNANTLVGTGLGLAISRELARGMGGDVVAESVAGTGSTFRLTLPRV